MSTHKLPAASLERLGTSTVHVWPYVMVHVTYHHPASLLRIPAVDLCWKGGAALIRLRRTTSERDWQRHKRLSQPHYKNGRAFLFFQNFKAQKDFLRQESRLYSGVPTRDYRSCFTARSEREDRAPFIISCCFSSSILNFACLVDNSDAAAHTENIQTDWDGQLNICRGMFAGHHASSLFHWRVIGWQEKGQKE